MRLIRSLAAVGATLALTTGCSDGSGIENRAPVADFDPPACTVDVPCNFVSKSTDDVGVTEWSWDLDGDGNGDANTATAAFSYDAVADYNVSLTVRDAEGLSHSKTATVTVAPPVGAPVANFEAPSCTATVPCEFTSTSSDDVTEWFWEFTGDATADAMTETASHTFATAGTFNVSLLVRDAEGLSNTKTAAITVGPPPPNAPPTADFNHSCAQAVCTFVSTSTDVAPGTIVSSTWTFGDGGTADVSSPSHTYSVTVPTEFTVTLTVTDNEGATAVVTKTIAVDPTPPANPPPVARFTYSCAGAVCTFVNTSYDHGGKVTASAWTFGDGGTSTETSPTHSYTVTTATEFTVTLTVTDDKGATGVTSQKFTLDPNAANIPPTADFTTWCYGDGCIFTSTSTDAAPGTIVSYAWSFGDGATAEWNNWIFPKHLETHVYTVSTRTKFTVTLTVTDNEGATAVATHEVAVSPLPPAVQGCTTSGNNVECVLDIPARSTLRVKLLAVHCDLRHFDRSRITTPPPVGDQIWLSVCSLPAGRESGIFGGTMDELWVYQAGSQARIWFTQGEARPSEPPRGPPAGQLSGTVPDWTLSFDDGDNAGAPGEPNFTDLVVGVHATQR
jgi:PKD repeat protein